MIDLHAHVLPGVDDGAETIEDALEMLRIAATNGTSELTLTPHYLTCDLRSAGIPKNQLLETFDSFKKIAAERFPNLTLHFGAEVFAANNIFDYIENNEIITLNSSRYILTEFAFDDSVHRALEITRKLQELGYTVIIAHPERYEFLLSDPRKVLSFLDAGALLQLNASSLLGASGDASREMSLALIDSGLAAMIASDTHSVFYRSPDLSEAYSFVSSTFSPEFAEALFTTNPKTVLNNGTIN